MAVIFFCISFFIATSYEQRSNKYKYTVLAFACLILAVIAGFREAWSWADAPVYMYSFINSPNIFNFSFSDQIIGYSEKGFYLLGVIVRTFTDDYHIFFLVVSLLSFYYLYKNLRIYSIFPIIGLFAYISRFYYGRHFIQIRAGLAYLILMISVKFIQEKDWKRYFLIVFIASLFHRSALIGIPLYFICNWIDVKKWHILVALAVSFIIGIWGQGFMHILVEDNASDLNIIRYSEAGGEDRQLIGLGIRNPMIYFQCFLLLSYTFLEKKIAPLNKYYYVIRIAYLYSTMILICFCSYKVLSARTSSMYATLEFAIIPSLIYLFNKKNRLFAIVAAGFVLTAIFYMYQ